LPGPARFLLNVCWKRMIEAKSILAGVVTAALLNAAAYAQAPAGQTSSPAAGSEDAAQDEVGFVRKARQWVERTQIVERLNGDIDGWYPQLGGMTRGSGFSIGPGYRFHLDDIFVDLSAGLSIKSYKAVDARVRWLQASDGRLELWTNYRFEDFPQEDFYGIGPDSLPTTQTSYDFDSSEIAAEALFKATRWLRVKTTLAFVSPEIGPGTDARFPSIGALFADASAPGLENQPDFLYTTIFADVDYRDERGNPRRGGYYHAAFGIWDDRTLDRYDFRRLDVDLWQFHPLNGARTHVVSGHIGASFVNNETGHRVPFYFLPYVGGVDTVRSFAEFRFKDENALWASFEYRWIPIDYASVAVFFDAGKVGANYQDINASGLKTGYGVGVRLHTRMQTFARIDVATGGGEGWKVFLKLGPGS
jgi:hypothetical protein